jgi:hypothetical protein
MHTAKELVMSVAACISEIDQAQREQKPGDWTSLLWEMDQRRELHRLLQGVN